MEKLRHRARPSLSGSQASEELKQAGGCPRAGQSRRLCCALPGFAVPSGQAFSLGGSRSPGLPLHEHWAIGACAEFPPLSPERPPQRRWTAYTPGPGQSRPPPRLTPQLLQLGLAPVFGRVGDSWELLLIPTVGNDRAGAASPGKDSPGGSAGPSPPWGGVTRAVTAPGSSPSTTQTLLDASRPTPQPWGGGSDEVRSSKPARATG